MISDFRYNIIIDTIAATAAFAVGAACFFGGGGGE